MSDDKNSRSVEKVERKISVEEYFDFVMPNPEENPKTGKKYTYNDEYYSKLYSKHMDNKFYISWNWGAALFTIFWCVYRKAYLLAFYATLIVFVFSEIVWFSGFAIFRKIFALDVQTAEYAVGSITFVLGILVWGIIANSLYQKQVIAWIKENRIPKKGVDGGAVVYIFFGLVPLLALSDALEQLKLFLIRSVGS